MVVERKNRTLQEMARTMIHENNLAKHLWAEALNTTCYVQNRIYIRPILEKTAYELFKRRRPNISYFHQFGCTCYILNNKLSPFLKSKLRTLKLSSISMASSSSTQRIEHRKSLDLVLEHRKFLD